MNKAVFADDGIAERLRSALTRRLFPGHEVRTFAKLARRGFSPRHIFDIGASSGVWSDVIVRVFPRARYDLFEPLADVVPKYTANLQRCLRRHPNFRLHKVALGANRQTVEMCVTDDGYSSTILEMGSHPEFQRRHPVEQHALDEYCQQEQLPPPDLIKMDVQGAERMILSRADTCLRSAALLFVETWFERGYGPDTPLLTELVEFLRPFEFVLAEIGDRFYDEAHRLYAADAYFVRRSVLQRFAPLLPKGPWARG